MKKKYLANFLKQFIITFPTVIVTLFVLENTKNYLYVALSFFITAFTMIFGIYFILKLFKKIKQKQINEKDDN